MQVNNFAHKEAISKRPDNEHSFFFSFASDKPSHKLYRDITDHTAF